MTIGSGTFGNLGRPTYMMPRTLGELGTCGSGGVGRLGGLGLLTSYNTVNRENVRECHYLTVSIYKKARIPIH